MIVCDEGDVSIRSGGIGVESWRGDREGRTQVMQNPVGSSGGAQTY